MFHPVARTCCPGFVHRDVRWSNLISFSANGTRRWVLIDLELAGRAGMECTGEQYPLPFWLEDEQSVLEAGNRYTVQSDLRMLARQLLGSTITELSSEAAAFKQRLLDGALKTAEQALADTWIS